MRGLRATEANDFAKIDNPSELTPKPGVAGSNPAGGTDGDFGVTLVATFVTLNVATGGAT